MMRAAVAIGGCMSLLGFASTAGCLSAEAPPADFSYSVACFLPDASAFPGLRLTCDDIVIDLSEPVNLVEVVVAPETREMVIVAPDVFSEVTVSVDGEAVAVETPAAPARIARVNVPALRPMLPCVPPPSSMEIGIAELGLKATIRIRRDCRLFTTVQDDDVLDPPDICALVVCGMTDLGNVGPGGVITVYITQRGRLVSGRELTVAVGGVFREDIVLRKGPSEFSIQVPHDTTPDPVIVFEIYDSQKTVLVARFCVY